MKVKLITSLKSRVLLVGEVNNNFEYGIQYSTENPNLRQIISIRKIGKNYPISNSKHKITYDLPKGKWQLLSTLKDLTYSDCEGLLEVKRVSLGVGTIYHDYKNKDKWLYGKSNPKSSFLSALEAEGVLFFNPLKTYVENYKDCSEFEESEQNVFSPETLIFVEH